MRACLVIAALIACASAAVLAPNQTYHELIAATASFNYDQNGDDWPGVCNTGLRQSPIALSSSKPKNVGIDENLLLRVRFDYADVAKDAKLLNNGHTIEVEISEEAALESSLVADGTVYHPVQFHFHSPSEHTIDGRHYPLEAHIVHTNDAGNLLVVGVLFKLDSKGEDNSFLDEFWADMPMTQDEVELALESIDLIDLLPSGRKQSFWTYPGSLTAPPCSEGLKWVVLEHENAVSQEQVKLFMRALSAVNHGGRTNNRPVQAANDRSTRKRTDGRVA